MTKKVKLPSSERREQILLESLRLFAERGVFQVSTRDIAQAVGISQPSLYAHFKSRDEIAIELSLRALTLFSARMESADAPDKEPADRLRHLGREYVRFGLEHSAEYRIAFMLERANLLPEDKVAIQMAGKRAFAMLHDLFKQVRQADDDYTAALAQSTWASMHGLVALMLARPAFPWVERTLLIDLHLDKVCRDAFS